MLPEKTTLHEASNTAVLGNYVVSLPGRADQKFTDAQQAIAYLVSTNGGARMFGPDGQIIVTRGQPPRD